jgi:hypothetical protein
MELAAEPEKALGKRLLRQPQINGCRHETTVNHFVSRVIKVYGPQGPKMTWEQRAKAGVDAKHFQEALKAKS